MKRTTQITLDKKVNINIQHDTDMKLLSMKIKTSLIETTDLGQKSLFSLSGFKRQNYTIHKYINGATGSAMSLYCLRNNFYGFRPTFNKIAISLFKHLQKKEQGLPFSYIYIYLFSYTIYFNL